LDELTPQQKANKKQNAVRINAPRYQLRMNKEEDALLDKLGVEHGSKKAAIIAGLALLEKVKG
jgi:hypothetical protein